MGVGERSECEGRLKKKLNMTYLKTSNNNSKELDETQFIFWAGVID